MRDPMTEDDKAVSESLQPPLLLRPSLPSPSDFRGLAEDREMMLRSADDAQRSGGETGSIDDEAFFTEGASEGHFDPLDGRNTQ